MIILGLANGKQSGESTKCFPIERSLPRGVFETSCGTHGENSLDATSESRAPKLRKDCMLTILHRTAGIIRRVNASCTAGTACIYGARICACFLRYRMKASLDQRPFTFITSNGTPRRRYSRGS